MVVGSGEVSVERFVPVRANPGEAGTIRDVTAGGEGTDVGYQWAWTRNADGVETVVTTRRIFLDGPMTEAQRGALQQRARAGLDRLVNDHDHRLPLSPASTVASPEGPVWRARVEFVDTAEQAHATVRVLPEGSAEPMRQDQWPVHASLEALGHETLHGFGLRDDEGPGDALLTPVPGADAHAEPIASTAMSVMGPRPAGVEAIAASMRLTTAHLHQIAGVLAPHFHRGSLPLATKEPAL